MSFGFLVSRAALCGSIVLALAACNNKEAGGGPPAGPGGQSGGGPPALPALVAEVSRLSLPVEVSTVGSLRSPETTLISADVSGIIVALNAPEGKEISRGHLIARLDEAETRAALQVAEARLKNARIELDRAKPLVEQGVAPQQMLDNATSELDVAEGLVEEARTRLSKTQIKAPFSGMVGIQTAQLGQYVSSGDPIIELTRISALELVFGVPEEQASLVRIGQVVEARVGRCGEKFEAVVEALDPNIDPNTRTLSVQARVDNRERRLIPGMSTRLRLVIEKEESRLVVPREALVSRGNEHLVWVVDEDSTVSPRNVVPGIYLPDVVEIKGQLEEGEKVVAAGHQKLGPGAKITEVPWQETVNKNLTLGIRNSEDCPDVPATDVPPAGAPGVSADLESVTESEATS